LGEAGKAWMAAFAAMTAARRRFLLLFFKKEVLSYFL
jgi:hypothetical protein